MPWTRNIQSGENVSESAVEGASRPHVAAVAVVLLALIWALWLPGAPSEKHLSIYSTVANYSLPLVQREGRDYVGLLELFEPLGKVSAKSDSQRWRLRYNNVEADFQSGKTHAQVQGRDADLGGKFLLENGRGLVPVGSLGTLMPRVLGGPVTVHEHHEVVGLCRPADYADRGVNGLVGGVGTTGWSA